MTTLDELADVRAGDKGDTLILAVLPRDDAAWSVVRELLTPALVAGHFRVEEVAVTRHEVPRLPGLVIRVGGALGAGVTGSVTLDGHGKALGYHLLGLELPTSSPSTGLLAGED